MTASYTISEFAQMVDDRLSTIVSVQVIFFAHLRNTHPELVSAFAGSLGGLISEAEAMKQDVRDMVRIHRVITSTPTTPEPTPRPKLRIVD
jgi:hypothetical protein